MKKSLAKLLAVTAAVIGVNATDASAQVYSSDGRSGVYVQGGGQGFAGTFGENGFQGVMMGPDGRVKRFGPANNPFRTPSRANRSQGATTGVGVGAFAGGGAAVGRGTPIGPGGFDPFSFVFGESAAQGGMAGVFGGSGVERELQAAKEAFRDGQYRESLQATNRILRVQPGDSEVYQLQALALVALQRYEQAAESVYEGLSLGTRWDWGRLRACYRDTETYVSHLRQLESAAGDDSAPNTAGVQFLLAYHYLVLDKSDHARAALRQTLQLQPENNIARELLESLPPQID